MIKAMTAEKEDEDMAECNEDVACNVDGVGNEDAVGGDDEEIDGSAAI